MPEKEPKEADTSVTTVALLKLINARAKTALRDEANTEENIQSIIDVTDDIIDLNESN